MGHETFIPNDHILLQGIQGTWHSGLQEPLQWHAKPSIGNTAHCDVPDS